ARSGILFGTFASACGRALADWGRENNRVIVMGKDPRPERRAPYLFSPERGHSCPQQRDTCRRSGESTPCCGSQAAADKNVRAPLKLCAPFAAEPSAFCVAGSFAIFRPHDHIVPGHTKCA